MKIRANDLTLENLRNNPEKMWFWWQNNYDNSPGDNDEHNNDRFGGEYHMFSNSDGEISGRKAVCAAHRKQNSRN